MTSIVQPNRRKSRHTNGLYIHDCMLRIYMLFFSQILRCKQMLRQYDSQSLYSTFTSDYMLHLCVDRIQKQRGGDTLNITRPEKTQKKETTNLPPSISDSYTRSHQSWYTAKPIAHLVTSYHLRTPTRTTKTWNFEYLRLEELGSRFLE